MPSMLKFLNYLTSHYKSQIQKVDKFAKIVNNIFIGGSPRQI